ncbi:MAG: isoleucine--tRNA ligase [Phycisphaerales bacterium]|nr:isoleucine--tRNA ligase [Phycisphaerales bacterium]
MFEPLPQDFSFPEAEKRILAFWEKHRIFEQSLELRRGAQRFVFYEGPPTANGLPHPGHCLTRAMKDLFPRYQTMCGKLVERKAGWDTHGLPVEVEVCKELGIHTKEEIEAYGVEKFNRKCIESVFRYTREWEELTRRLGFWVNLEDAYVTFHQQYVESVWWSLKTLFERGLLYQGHKVVWWWAQGGTALSAGEVGEGYRTVQDPSVYVRFPLRGEGTGNGEQGTGGGTEARRHEGTEGGEGAGNREQGAEDGLRTWPAAWGVPAGKRVSLLVWTTTPWTLVSNHFAAVAPEIDYAIVHDQAGDEYFVIAEALVADVAQRIKRELPIVARCKGEALVGLGYAPPFDAYARSLAGQTDALSAGGSATLAWRVVPADFVELGTGTGIVHIAPAYGEVDFGLLLEERKRFIRPDVIPLLNAVAPNGTFNNDAPPQYRGRWVKDCDKEIIRELRERGLLLHQGTIEHEYPFCPRSPEDPLIQYARQSWFVRTSQFREQFIENNAQIRWLPEHIREGRFGDFLRNNVDWALSRERYWGTPLPIWVCEKTGRMEAIGSLAELKAKPGASDATPEYPGGMWATKKAQDPTLPDHLQVHKPYIDAWTYDSPFADEEGTQARRHEGTKGEEGTRNREQRGGKPRMRRVPDVIDCWWDAGSMPFAQWGFPHAPGSIETFRERFPADFISEAIDQTRGWFYGLLSISTLLFSGSSAARAPTGNSPFATGSSPFPHPYRACIVLGHMMGEDGNKMSKRLRNYREPAYVFDTYGADAMRWYFFSAQVPWTSTRFVEAAIRDAQREFLVRLYNVFSFFNIYANIDGFVAHPTQGSPWRPTRERGELDRWIISELFRTVRFVREKLDAFENYPAAGRINEFVDALSNWYVRRSRDRFWRPVEGEGTEARRHGRTKDSGEGTEARRHGGTEGTGNREQGTGSRGHVPVSPADQDKWDAYHTLYGVLLELSKLIAPFTPFFAEVMYQNLAGTEVQPDGGTKSADAVGDEHATDATGTPSTADVANSSLRAPVPSCLRAVSVHLCDYPVADESLIDEQLAAEMDIVRDIVSLGRAARTSAKLKVRQPLAQCEIVLARSEHAAWLEDHRELIAEELNIKRVEFTTQADQYVTYEIKPDFKVIGPRFGKLAPQIGAAVQKLDPAAARRALETDGAVSVQVGGETLRLGSSEVQVRLAAKPGWSAAQGRAGVVVVRTELTPELIDEGLARELVHHVQGLRKDQNLPYEARVTLTVDTPDADLRRVVEHFTGTIRHECLVEEIRFAAASSAPELKVEGRVVRLAIEQR